MGCSFSGTAVPRQWRDSMEWGISAVPAWGRNKENAINRFTDSIKRSIESRNWLSAIALTLTIPDICGALETPNEGNGVRYKRWFGQWMEPNYTVDLPGCGRRAFLTADSCWALRCSYLHAGSFEVRHQKIEFPLKAFHFIEPPGNGNTIHMNRIGAVLQIQSDVFCEEMITAVKEWQASIGGMPEIQDRLRDMLQIHSSVPAIGY